MTNEQIDQAKARVHQAKEEKKAAKKELRRLYKEARQSQRGFFGRMVDGYKGIRLSAYRQAHLKYLRLSDQKAPQQLSSEEEAIFHKMADQFEDMLSTIKRTQETTEEVPKT